MTIAISLGSFLVIFSLMVFVHELGHFMVAKKAGVRVREFGFGYPLAPDRPPSQRLAFWRAPKEERRSQRPLAWQIARDKSGTIYSINLIPFGGFVNLGENDADDPTSLAHFSKRVRLATMLAGPLMNLILAFLIFVVAALVGYPQFLYGVGILEVQEGSPAEAAGIQANDIVLRVGDLALDGFAVDSQEAIDMVNRMVEYMASQADQTIPIVVQRGLGDDARQLTLEVTPRANEAGEGKIGVGIQATPVQIQRVKASFLKAMGYGANQILYTVEMTFYIPIQVIRGLLPASSARGVGPIGIARLTGEAVQQSLNVGWSYPILQLIGVLNVAIAITNLLPLPALDGGRIFFILLEAIRGKPIPPEKEGLVHGIGLMLLLLLLVVITIQDIFVPLPQGFNWSDYF